MRRPLRRRTAVRLSDDGAVVPVVVGALPHPRDQQRHAAGDRSTPSTSPTSERQADQPGRPTSSDAGPISSTAYSEAGAGTGSGGGGGGS